jgi:hypothetical protein
MILIAGFSRAARRIVCRAPWSADEVTEHVLTTSTSASTGALSDAPRDKNASPIRSESA